VLVILKYDEIWGTICISVFLLQIPGDSSLFTVIYDHACVT